jgi:RNA polymerase sigma-32 factor
MAQAEIGGDMRINRELVRNAMNQPILSREHEQDLARRWREQGDEEALHEMVNSYMRLVISTATRFKNYGLPMGDLTQEGVVGLMQAAERFEPDREVRFSTYATWWIRSAMQDYVLRNWSIVRTGTTAAQKSLFFNLRRLRSKIDAGTSNVMSDDDRASIAETLNVGVRDVESMELRLSGGDQSLNATISADGEDSWQDFLSDDRPSPDDLLEHTMDGATRSQWLKNSLSELNDREQIIIRERRLREDGRTLEELGVRLGISKERVRQIEHRALQKLKASLMDRIQEPSEQLLFTSVPA